MTQANLTEFGVSSTPDDEGSFGLRVVDAPRDVGEFERVRQDADCMRYRRGPSDGFNQVVELRRTLKNYEINWLRKDGGEILNGGAKIKEIRGSIDAQEAAKALVCEVSRRSFTDDKLRLPPACELVKNCRSWVAKHEEYDASVSEIEMIRTLDGRMRGRGFSAHTEPETVQGWSERAATLSPDRMLDARRRHEEVMDRVHGERSITDAHELPEHPDWRDERPIHPAFPRRERASRLPPYHPDDREDPEPSEEVAQIEADLSGIARSNTQRLSSCVL